MSAYTKETSPLSEILIPALKGLAVAVIAAAVFLFGFTAVAYAMEDPDSFTAPLGYLALYLSAAVAGGVSSRLSGDTGGGAVLSAATAGAMMLLVLVLMAFLPAESGNMSPLITILMYAAIPAVAALTGLIFRQKRVRKIKHKRRR